MIDLTNKQFGKWRVIRKSSNKTKNGVMWVCKCDCGTNKEVLSQSLRNGRSKSCGCFKIAKMTSHGLGHYPLYNIFTTMKQRCYSPSHDSYRYYGERGITVCEQWLNNPKLFIEWALVNGYSRSLQIDRIDVNGNYTPNNCRFVTASVNRRNRRKP